MKTTMFEQIQAQTGLSSENLEAFMIFYIQESARFVYSTRSEGTFSWEIPGRSNTERRLLLGYDHANAAVTISIEVAYQLFEGDTHYFVKEAGSIIPDQFGKPLSNIIAKALAELRAWVPSYELFN